MMNLRQLLAASALALLGACGGGGGSTPPVISNLVYSPAAAYQNSGAGQVTVGGSFTVTGANGGIASVTIAVLDGTGATVTKTTSPVAGGSGVTSGTVQGSVTASTAVLGTYTIRVTLTDIGGLTSNALSGSFRVAPFPWVAKTAVPQARDFFATATVGGRAYVVGGEVLGTSTTPGPASSRVDVYDPATDQWSTTPPMSQARVAPAAAVAGGLLYVFGGSGPSGGIDLQTVEVFDPLASTWTLWPAMPTPRSGAAAATVGNLICVFGGTSAGQDLSTTECLDTVSKTWTSGVPPMPTFRRALGADALGGLAYAVGGYSGGNLSGGGPGYVATVERYDPIARTWASLAPMSTVREYEGVVAASGLLYAIGGDFYSGGLATVEAFNPMTGTWGAKTAMPLALSRIGAVSIGNAVYVFEQGHTLQYTPANDIL
jgi:N-acetylneuraminic acid mutarotase